MSLPFSKKDKVPCRHYMQGKCNKGKLCPFAHIDRRDGAQSSAIATVLKLVIEKQNGVILVNNGELLNLTSLAACPDLAKVATSIDFDSQHFCDALVAVVKEACPMMRYLCVDDNGIRSLYHLLRAFERADMHVLIRGISAQNNNIATLEFIKQMKPFCNLNEIKLNGNPVSDVPDYRAAVRKGLPNLEGLDGGGVNRPPLNLPWPVPSPIAIAGAEATHALETRLAAAVVDNLFKKAERLIGSGSDCISAYYNDDAIFSLTLEGPEAAMKAPTLDSEVARRNVLLRDFISVRMGQMDRDNNLKTVRSVRSARGRTDVSSALRATLYPKSLFVTHAVDPNVDVTVIPGKLNQLAMVNVHGSLTWRHTEQATDFSPVSVTRLFDRSITLLIESDTPLQFSITNDAITLRQDKGSLEPLLFSRSAKAAATLAAKHNLIPAIVDALLPSCTNDLELDLAVAELAVLTAEQLEECLQAAGGDQVAGASIARIVSRFRVVPATAVEALVAAAGNFDLAVSDPSAFTPVW